MAVPWYCDAVRPLPPESPHHDYHDNEYGFPLYSDDALFARLVLEINQAGLSWITILKKKAAFYEAYDGLLIERVAAYTEQDIHRLLANAGIIRNRKKIEAAIENAKRIRAVQQEFGSFANWLDSHHPKSKEQWVQLFKKSFVFTGGEIVNEFLMSTGYLSGAHHESCPVYKRILHHQPKWLITKTDS